MDNTNIPDKMEQDSLFEVDKRKEWEKEWQDMPEYKQEKLSFKSILIHFRNQEDIDKFSELIGQKIFLNKAVVKCQPSIWFPKKDIVIAADKRYIDEEDITNEVDNES